MNNIKQPSLADIGNSMQVLKPEPMPWYRVCLALTVGIAASCWAVSWRVCLSILLWAFTTALVFSAPEDYEAVIMGDSQVSGYNAWALPAPLPSAAPDVYIQHIDQPGVWAPFQSEATNPVVTGFAWAWSRFVKQPGDRLYITDASVPGSTVDREGPFAAAVGTWAQEAFLSPGTYARALHTELFSMFPAQDDRNAVDWVICSLGTNHDPLGDPLTMNAAQDVVMVTDGFPSARVMHFQTWDHPYGNVEYQRDVANLATIIGQNEARRMDCYTFPARTAGLVFDDLHPGQECAFFMGVYALVLGVQ